MDLSRRDALVWTLTCSGVAALPGEADASNTQAGDRRPVSWRRGLDNQRVADLGDGRFLNPVLPGDHPDPSILKDGSNYYMTHSSFDSYPALVIWHSRDLVNWRPLGPALTRNVGSVWAPELIRHRGRYYIYVGVNATPVTSYVLWADKITGPWSEPIDLRLPGHIDPGHAVGEDGSRWLFLSGGDRVRLADDGLSTVGRPEHVYDPWRYPENWDVESFSPEGPKVLRRGGWYYLILAVGGTAGPPTGHMVISARSRSIHGPWEHCPHNPIVRTANASERWWSRGHATLVEGPAGDWWSVYHGYENGYWTLGRQTLLDPVEWTADGWFRMKGGDLSRPIAKPADGEAVRHGQALSDDFRTLELGGKWNFFKPSPREADRARVAGGALTLAARGASPSTSSPLLLTAGDLSYQFECDVEIAEGGVAGLLLFYDRQLYCGLGFNSRTFIAHQYGKDPEWGANPHGRRMRLRVTNDRHIVSFHTSVDRGRTWKRFDRSMEVSGYHHNVRDGFLMLRPGLYSAGTGEATFRDFRFSAL